MTDYVFLVIGLVLLLVGGDLLVKGAVGLAEKFSIPPLIIGLTIVSFGTSAPELFISVQAALNEAGGIAIGNVVGSNIANVMLVLGIPALIAAIQCDEKGISKNLVVMLGFTIVFMDMLSDGALSRFDGSILVGLLFLFLYDQYRAASTARSDATHQPDYHDEVDNIPTNGWVIAALIIGGLVLLPYGANWTVEASTTIARSWSVPDEVIGLTIVAIGTSLPELATTMMSVIRSNAGVALGNIVGSNIFNIAAIMGITTLIQPIAIADHIINLDMWTMFGAAVVLAILTHFQFKIGKRVGVAMLLAYSGYVYMAFIS